MIHPRTPLLTLCVLALALGCHSGLSKASFDDVHPVSRHIMKREYQKALRLAEKEARSRPEDPQAQERYRLASVAWLLERGRRLCFEGENEQAYEYFRQALELAPEEAVVRQWNVKIVDKLADQWMDVAWQRFSDDDLTGARDAYETVLEYRPGDTRASEALSVVLLRLNYREGMSSSYYDDGVKKLRDYWLRQSLHSFGASVKYLSANLRAEGREQMVEGLLADQRAALAAELENQQQYFAASNEFRLALLMDPENERAQEGYERTLREAKAAKVLDQAEMLTLKKDFDEAERVLLEGMPGTELQTELFEGALAGVEEGRLGDMYEKALILESDLKYAQAVAAYNLLLERVDYYSDALTRRDTLQGFIDKAAELYAEAQKEGGVEKLATLHKIATFWPEYEDIAEQIESLERALASEPASEPGGSGR